MAADPKKGQKPQASSEASGGKKAGTASKAAGSSRAGGAAAASSPSNPAARQRAESLGFLALTAGILVALNVIGLFLFTRIDATRNRAYSLADGSRRVVAELDETLTITAYFTNDLPAPFNATERYVRDILDEYESASNGNVIVRFVSPDTDDEREEAERAGVQEVQHQHIENDSVSVVEGYRGIVFEYLGNRQAIPVVQPDTEGLEYAITMAIKQLTGDELPIGILSGHDGPTLTKGLGTLERMLPLYDFREVSATEAIDEELRALLVIDPHNEIGDAELRNIDQFVMRGGSLGVFGGELSVDIEGGADLAAAPTNSGINTLLEGWGIRFRDGIVADAQCGRVPMRTPMGIPLPVPYPPAPIVTFDDGEAEHPVLFRLTEAPLFFVTPIETTDAFRALGAGEEDVLGATVLMQSSASNSWLLEGDSISLRIREPREWGATMRTAESGPFALGVAVEATLPSAFAERELADGALTAAEGPVRVLVIGTSTPIRDEFLPNPDSTNPSELAGAMAFPLNAIDWLAQDSDLIAIRAKTIEEPALEVPQSVQDATAEVLAAAEEGDEAEARAAFERRTAALEAWESRKRRYRWMNMALIPAAVAAFGIVRWQMRQRKKASLRI